MLSLVCKNFSIPTFMYTTRYFHYFNQAFQITSLLISKKLYCTEVPSKTTHNYDTNLYFCDNIRCNWISKFKLKRWMERSSSLLFSFIYLDTYASMQALVSAIDSILWWSTSCYKNEKNETLKHQPILAQCFISIPRFQGA